MESKGQLSYDFLFAFALFLIVYAAVFSFLPFLTIGTMEEPDVLAMESKLLSETLVKSPGYPKNWTNTASCQKLGLAHYNTTYYPNIIDYNKTDAVDSVNCNTLWGKTTVDIKFLIRVETPTATFGCSGTIPSDARLIERPAYMFNGTGYVPVIVKLYTWL